MPMGGLLAAGIGSGVLSGVFGYLGDKEQANAAEEAARINAEMMERARQQQVGAGYTANNLLNDALPGVIESREQGFDAAMDFGTQGFGTQRSDILGGGALGADAIGQGMGGALDSLFTGAGQGIGYVGDATSRATDTLKNRQDRAGAMLDQEGGLYGGFETSPGYEFRRQSGEDAIRRMQAAQGGRFGGAAMKALVDYNQDFASNEFDKFAGRAVNEFGARTSSDAQGLQADSQIAGLISGAGNTAAGIATQTGRDAAGVYSQGGGQLADIFTQTGLQSGAAAAGAGAALGGAAQDFYNGLGDLEYGTANQMGQNLMQGAGAGVALAGTEAANNMATVPYAGSGWANAANAANQIGQVGILAGVMGSGSRPAYNPAAVEGTAQFVGPPSTLAQPLTQAQAPATVGTGFRLNPAILTRTV